MKSSKSEEPIQEKSFHVSKYLKTRNVINIEITLLYNYKKPRKAHTGENQSFMYLNTLI